MRSRKSRAYTSGGQTRREPRAGERPVPATVTLPSASTLQDFITVRRPDICANSDCKSEIARNSRALYDREYRSVYCLRCAVSWMVRRAADKPVPDRERVIRIVCSLYEVDQPDALPDPIRGIVAALLATTAIGA